MRLLNKSRIDTGAKMASDAAFNLAAQMLAARLNVAAQAVTCATSTAAIANAQNLLATTHFNGKTHDKLPNAQTAQANNLATKLDQYNNGLVC